MLILPMKSLDLDADRLFLPEDLPLIIEFISIKLVFEYYDLVNKSHYVNISSVKGCHLDLIST